MAKALKKEPPTSSVAGLLDVNIGAAAIKPPQNTDAQMRTPPERQVPEGQVSPPPAPLPEPGPIVESTSVMRQFSLSHSTSETLKELVEVYSRASGLDLKLSEVLRAVLVALDHAMPELRREAVHIGRLKRPKHERGNEGLRDELDRKIARAIVAGMRAAKTME
jgi:hypothetical protein